MTFRDYNLLKTPQISDTQLFLYQHMLRLLEHNFISPHFSYTSTEPLASSSKTHFPKGSGQVYNSAPKHKVKPSMFTEEEVSCFLKMST